MLTTRRTPSRRLPAPTAHDFASAYKRLLPIHRRFRRAGSRRQHFRRRTSEDVSRQLL